MHGICLMFVVVFSSLQGIEVKEVSSQNMDWLSRKHIFEKWFSGMLTNW